MNDLERAVVEAAVKLVRADARAITATPTWGDIQRVLTTHAEALRDLYIATNEYLGPTVRPIDLNFWYKRGWSDGAGLKVPIEDKPNQEAKDAYNKGRADGERAYREMCEGVKG
jgi:hypothetical protein